MPRVARFPVLYRYVLHARLLWASAPGLSLLCVLLTAVSAFASAGSLVTTGRLVNALATRSAHDAVRWAVASAVLFVTVPLASSFLAAAGRAVSARYLRTVCDSLMEAGTHPYGIEHLEDRGTSARLEAIGGHGPRDGLFLAGVDAVWILLAARLSGIGTFVILAAWRWWAPVLLAAGWMVYSRSFSRWSSTKFDQLLDITGNDRRRAGYLHCSPAW